MKAQGWYQTLIGRVFSLMLILVVSGCGGSAGGDGTSPGVSPSPGPGVSPFPASISDPCRTLTSNELVFADTGKIVAVRINQTANLNGGCSSTTLNDPLAYAWSFTDKPDGSTVQLQGAASVSPSFVPDVAGTYRVQLVVSAGNVSSPRAVAYVEASVEDSSGNGHYTGIRVHKDYRSVCSECHAGLISLGSGPVDPVRPKFGAHPATTNICQACHTTFGFEILRHIDHLEVFGNCSDCHNGVVAIGKSESHVTTVVECDSCHDTTSFLVLDINGKYDHTGVTNGCATCHNGRTAIGTNHIIDTPAKSNNECSFCHTITSFENAYPDHSNITDNCASCHNGTDATGPIVGHPVMSVDCGICHTTTNFSLGGVFNHRVDASVQPCADCHNDNNSINARGKIDFSNHVDTTADCGVCHGVGDGDFALGILDHSDPTVMAQACDSCHGVTALGKSINHMPTLLDCGTCHTSGTFKTGVFDHDVNVVNLVTCTSCHDGVITAGKNVTHIPTTNDCRVCHTTDTFVGAVFDHVASGITNNCASCHNGNISTGKNRNHMSTIRDCSDCHVTTNFVDFTGATFDHLDPVVTNICATCHDGVIALGKKVDHIPAQTECTQCHIGTSRGAFKQSVFISNVHPDLSTGCEGCHTSRFLPAFIKASTHLPTSQDCHFCHTNDAFTPSIFDHSGISGNCVSCHDGSADNIAAGAIGKTPTHPDTTEDCGVCHGVSGTFADAAFDHTGRVDNCNECHETPGTATKKNIGHVTTTQDCSVCHVPGTFATAVFSHDGIVDNCASCHDGTAATATVMSVNHISTPDDCSVCHNTTAFAGAKFDHTGVVNNCKSCHDGTTALGKDGNHVPTNDDCSVCHQTTGFIPAIFDHVGIVDNCTSCHDGSLAIGKTNGHVQTNADCGACHNTQGFIPATFDHSTLSTNTRCDSCHIEGSSTATGKDDKTNPLHLSTSLDCRDCHTTATFVGGTWVHDSSTAGNCDTCHNGTDATDKSGGHLSTNEQCDVCHTTNAWAPTDFKHSSQGNYPGDHRLDPGCDGCHKGAKGEGINSDNYPNQLVYAPFCAGCHAGDFEREGDHNGGSNGTVEQNKNCAESGCHRVGDSGF